MVGDRGNGQSIQWRHLYRAMELASEEDVLVFLVAHEAFHYLRKTRQVEDRPGEIEAHAFALKMLEQYRDVMNIDRQSTDTWSSVRWSHDLGMVLH